MSGQAGLKKRSMCLQVKFQVVGSIEYPENKSFSCTLGKDIWKEAGQDFLILPMGMISMHDFTRQHYKIGMSRH